MESDREQHDKVRFIGQDRALQQEVFRQTRQESESRLAELQTEEQNMHRDLEYAREEVNRLLARGGAPDRLADFQARLLDTETRLREVRNEIQVLGTGLTDESTLCRALTSFDPVWASLTPREQTRLVELLVERVEYDGATGKLSIAFHSTGVRSLADELARKEIA